MNQKNQKESLSLAEKKALLAVEKICLNQGKCFALIEDIRKSANFNQLAEAKGAVSWLQKKGLVELEEKVDKVIKLGAQGKDICQKGLPERRALEYISMKGGTCKLGDLSWDLSEVLSEEEIPPAIGWLKRKKWAFFSRGNLQITERGTEFLKTRDEDEKVLMLLSEKGEIPASKIPEEIIKSLKARKNVIEEKERGVWQVRLTPHGKKILENGLSLAEELGELTPEMLRSGEWKGKDWQKYDVSLPAARIKIVKKHPITQLIERIRKIFLEFGFTEITGNYIESSFWTLDSLFIPQYHPDRTEISTFFLKDPKELWPDKKIMDKIKRIHMDGGDTGSHGWEYPFSVDESVRPILRTHTTVNTIKYLFDHPNPPLKIFSVEKAFRREAIDSTHLPEFYQIEGVICEEGANLRKLMGILKECYKRLGFEKIRFKPTYFPYTEPSVEIEIYWNGKWLELGGSGIFRPEVMKPTGIKVPALAWGLGLERLALLTYNGKDIRDFYFNDLEKLEKFKVK